MTERESLFLLELNSLQIKKFYRQRAQRVKERKKERTRRQEAKVDAWRVQVLPPTLYRSQGAMGLLCGTSEMAKVIARRTIFRSNLLVSQKVLKECEMLWRKTYCKCPQHWKHLPWPSSEPSGRTKSTGCRTTTVCGDPVDDPCSQLD